MGPLVVLAYSGGLDTSAIVPWLRERYDATVICVAADVGQGAGELRGIEEKAQRSGAEACVVEDVRERFVREFIWPDAQGRRDLRAHLPARHVDGAAAHRRAAGGAARGGWARTALAHGCTGKGNDQVRFELTYAAFAPDLQIIAPWREWEFRGREDLLAYLKEKGIPTTATAEKPFSRDRNLWHISHEGGSLEDPWQRAAGRPVRADARSAPTRPTCPPW